MTTEALLAACGVEDQVLWRKLGRRRLETAHRAGDLDLQEALKRAHPSLVWNLWLPLLTVLERRLGEGPPVLIGLNGPVGAGKSTLAQVLRALAAQAGIHLAIASIDDAYLPWEERQKVLTGNPFGVGRVPPGSHGSDVFTTALGQWRQGGLLRLPRFDKTLRGGEGDRCGWSEQRADAVLLEGWLLGCRPIPQDQLTAMVHAQGGASGLGLSEAEVDWLPRWNQALGDYGPLWEHLDTLWILRPVDWTCPRRWRLQAEAQQRRRYPGSGLTPANVEALVRASLGSLPPSLYQDPLLGKAEGVALIDRQRRCPWSGTGAEAPSALAQLSLSSSTSAIG
ncbi:hypothetical protein [Cyanobium sp. Morenito 9A2]|uniref:hypothetical protein n=1 Tax=Cyanobium sp. Morenito 9A2 TaxID=2823718 RepID=UPI0020CBD182|nr:hypothetical protein [Cyanobium sp. Morenito 9A2]MCP9848674.1 hypothetical protein [Cyanobium sp. Morenito 9A2]